MAWSLLTLPGEWHAQLRRPHLERRHRCLKRRPPARSWAGPPAFETSCPAGFYPVAVW